MDKTSSFNEDTLEYFRSLRSRVPEWEIRADMVEFIYIDCEWEDERDRRNLLQELIEECL